jgi:hypothetical protein
MRIGQAELGELVTRPVVGALHIGRAGQPWANGFKQPVCNLPDMRVVKAFIANPGNHVQIDFFRHLAQAWKREKHRSADREQSRYKSQV